jgi:hypothetical protein
MRKGDTMRTWVDLFADRLSLEMPSLYASLLNPVEPLWSWLRRERLNNLGPKATRELDARMIAELARSP